MNSNSNESTLMAQYAAGPGQLERALSGLKESEYDTRVSESGWTIREAVHHIVDGDHIWKIGIMAALGTQTMEFTLGWYWGQPQENWSKGWGYNARPVEESLALLKANRAHTLQMLKHIPDAMRKSVDVRNVAGEVEHITVEFLLQMQVDHITHHTNQILALRAKGTST